MNCYVLGAIPPYNVLLCGKMIACLVRSRDVRDAFHEVYFDRQGTISQQKKHPRLTVVTASSALDRSSMYNRLRLDGIQYFSLIGESAGWGHFHISDQLYQKLRAYLARKNHPYASNNRFGHGPNWRFRVTRAALEQLGFDGDLLRHGIGRELFGCEVAANGRDFLRGTASVPCYGDLLPASGVAERAISRWILPRSERSQAYRRWEREHTLDLFGAALAHRQMRDRLAS